ncbi:tripartite tricarboxylate transporter substrate binding protein [Fredinandcohnia sp. 179-A 10B2 NHS]|uniref:tripartite tricarboxylate transporter substrate binding protein n=1 Tax=Fredinandcohnia sp. 179-A 10B2 NHS TaxID=3235176 RepID=UPI0039A26EEA
MKKSFWYRGLWFGFVCLLFFTLVACNSSSSSGNKKEGETGNATATYPEKEITIIVPWAAGGGTDAIARQIASFMEQDLGKPVVIVNKEGGGGVVGFKEIANSKADGYTIGFISNSLLLQKYSSETFVDYKSFEPITLVNQDPASLAVPANSPYKTADEFIAAAKAENGKFRISNSGPGGIWHVSALKLGIDNGIEFTHVPYEGGNPAAVAAAGGFVEGTTVSAAEVSSLVDAGELKILGIASEERLPQFPDVPTLQEQGVDTVIGVWRGFVAPKGTPKEIIDSLNASISKAVETDEYKEFMNNGGFGIRYIPSSDFGPFMDDEDQNYKTLFETME